MRFPRSEADMDNWDWDWAPGGDDAADGDADTTRWADMKIVRRVNVAAGAAYSDVDGSGDDDDDSSDDDDDADGSGDTDGPTVAVTERWRFRRRWIVGDDGNRDGRDQALADAYGGGVKTKAKVKGKAARRAGKA